MRSVKLLWGVTVFLLVLVILLCSYWLRTRFGGADPYGKTIPSGPQDKVLARIGDHEIKTSVLEQRLFTKHGAELLNQLIDREAIQMEADELGLKVTREEIDQELKRMQQGYDSEQHFYDSMKQQLGLSKDEIREDVFYRLLLEHIAIRDIHITEADVDAYIAAHPEEFGKTLSLRIQQIINKTIDQANRTIELYRSGRDFAQLAKERSIDTNTASEGGDLGWIENNDPFIPFEILKAARSLEVGQISGPIEVAQGYAVIRLKDRKEQTKGNASATRESIQKQLALQQATPLPEIIKTLREKRNASILDPKLKL